MTSRNDGNYSIYEKQHPGSDYLKKTKAINTVYSNSKQFGSTYTGNFDSSDMKNDKTPKTRSIGKMEEIYSKTEKDLDRDIFERRLKEKYLKVLANKKKIKDFDFNDMNLKNSINHSFALGVILLEKVLNKCIIFEEEELLYSNIYEFNQHLFEILTDFQKIYSNLLSEKTTQTKLLDDLREKVNILTIEKERDLKKNNEFLSYKALYKTPDLDINCKIQMELLQNKFNLKIQKLLSENDHLKLLINRNEKIDKINLLEQEFRASIEESSNKIKHLKGENELISNKAINLEFINQNQKNVIRSYEQELKVLGEELEETTRIKEKHESMNIILKEKARSAKETTLMQNEEINSIKLQSQDKMEILNKIKENYFSIQNKLTSMSQLKEYPKGEDFQQNLELLSEICSHFRLSKHFGRNFHKLVSTLPLQTTRFPQEENENNLEKTNLLEKKYNESLDSINSIDLTRLSYTRCSFFSLIETKYKKIDLSDSKLNKTSAFSIISETLGQAKKDNNIILPTHFIALIRGILDSKWNEFLFYDDYRLYSRFPDFVYSWLGKFEIKLETRSVFPSNNQDPDEDRCQFLKNLIHPIIDKHWESITFREFLEEQSSLDEVYFYLYCRNLLFKGPQLDHSQGKFCFVHYVSFEFINEIIDNVFRSFEDEALKFLKKKLKSKTKAKGNKLLIDSGFVLRVFLEYYRLERKHRYRLLQELFLIKAQNKVYIKYEEFKQIIESFQTNTSELEKSQLYRECFNVGHSKIDPEVIFVVLSENNFFIKTIKTRLGNFIPKKIIENENSSNDININKIFDNFASMEPKINEISNIAGSMGLENLFNDLQYYKKIFKKQLSFENSELQGKSIPYYYFKYHELLMGVRNFEIYIRTTQKIISEEEILKTELFFFENVYNCVNKIRNKQIIQDFEMNSNAKRIQKWVQYRFSRWLKLLYTLFKVKIHNKKVNNLSQANNINTINIKSALLREKKN